MTKYDQIPFLLSLTLEGFHKVGNNYNSRCPVCGDSQKSKSKKRLWFLIDKVPETIIVYCHNCGLSTNIKEFIRQVDPVTFEAYCKKEKEEFLAGLKKGSFNLKQKTVKPDKMNSNIQYQFLLNEKYFKPAKDFPEAIEFCKKRKIIDKIDSLYYNTNIKSVLNGMVIFPFYMEDNKTLYGFMGRHTSSKLFNVFSKNNSFKSYGVFQVDKTKPVIVVESIIDSMNIDNAIAMVGADLTTGVREYLKDCKLIYANDNDLTGIKKALKYAEQKEKVFVWPKNIKVKDFNDLSIKGWTKEQITKMIMENSFEGIELKTRLTFKMMEKK